MKRQIGLQQIVLMVQELYQEELNWSAFFERIFDVVVKVKRDVYKVLINTL